MSQVLIAAYDEMESAHQAIQELLQKGFSIDSVGFAANDMNEQFASVLDQRGQRVATGVGVGAIIGGIASVLTTLVLQAIPGVGQIAAAGPFLYMLGLGTVSGGAIGGLVTSMRNAGMSQEDAHAYETMLRQGKSLVAVEAPTQRLDEAIAVLDKHDPIDIDAVVTELQADGWQKSPLEIDTPPEDEPARPQQGEETVITPGYPPQSKDRDASQKSRVKHYTLIPPR